MQQKDESRAAMLDYLRSIDANAAWLESGGFSDEEYKALIAALKKLLQTQKSKGVFDKEESQSGSV